MSFSDFITKGSLAASLANSARREKAKALLLDLLQEAKTLNDQEVEKLIEKRLDSILEISSPLNVAGAVTKEILLGLAEQIGNNDNKKDNGD